ncbi:MAG: hypothetical protein ACYCXW_04690 [Solirubrobacteraceae bacterium]
MRVDRRVAIGAAHLGLGRDERGTPVRGAPGGLRPGCGFVGRRALALAG